MATLTPSRLPASSLVEVTVASVVLVIVFSLALGSLARLALSGPQHLSLRGQQLVAQVAAATIREHTWQTQAWQEGAIRVSREVSTAPETPSLFTLRITASVRDHEIARWQQLVYDPPQPIAP